MELEAKANYEEYLFRMAQLANESTKSLLPLYFQGRKRILDVGCADGTMMEKLQTICSGATYSSANGVKYHQTKRSSETALMKEVPATGLLLC